jgi:hypothetical protein
MRSRCSNQKATTGTVQWERQNKLKPIYKEIANVWNKMKGGRDYRIELDDKSVPILFKQNQKFDI